LELHHYLLEKEILLNNGKLPEWDFKNIVTVALRAGETSWAEKFINDYKNSLPEEVRENAYCYNKAAYYHSVGRFEEAMQLLQEVDFTDESYQVGSKIILLKSYFEMGEYNAAISLIDAFRRQIERSKTMSAYRKQSNINLLIAAKKIFKFQRAFDYSSKTVLKKYLKSIETSKQKLQPMANVDWVEEKLKSMKIELSL
jgi:tetratricopeptide (TPR) repeat protein